MNLLKILKSVVGGVSHKANGNKTNITAIGVGVTVALALMGIPIPPAIVGALVAASGISIRSIVKKFEKASKK